MTRLKGRIAAVVGGASGMGRATSLRFAQEGAIVYVLDYALDAAKAVVAEIVAAGGIASALQVDATQPDSLGAAAETIEKDHGVLHVVHTQVGGPSAIGFDVSLDDFEKAVALNMKSAFYVVSATRALLARAEGHGAIILTGSTSALVASPASPLYSLVKSALIGFTKAAAVSLAADGTRVNCICPGSIETPMLPKFFAQNRAVPEAEARDRFLSSVPLGRFGKPEEIAGTAAFLASDDAGFVTGVTIPVDGGLVAR